MCHFRIPPLAPSEPPTTSARIAARRHQHQRSSSRTHTRPQPAFFTQGQSCCTRTGTHAARARARARNLPSLHRAGVASRALEHAPLRRSRVPQPRSTRTALFVFRFLPFFGRPSFSYCLQHASSRQHQHARTRTRTNDRRRRTTRPCITQQYWAVSGLGREGGSCRATVCHCTVPTLPAVLC